MEKKVVESATSATPATLTTPARSSTLRRAGVPVGEGAPGRRAGDADQREDAEEHPDVGVGEPPTEVVEREVRVQGGKATEQEEVRERRPDAARRWLP